MAGVSNTQLYNAVEKLQAKLEEALEGQQAIKLETNDIKHTVQKIEAKVDTAAGVSKKNHEWLFGINGHTDEAVLPRLTRLEKHLVENPPLLWLLRFKTKETITVIVLVFIILSIWYVSGIRQPILEWLGLPIF